MPYKPISFVVTAKSVIGGLRNLVLRKFDSARLKPVEVIFEVTDACNSRCLHCNIWRKKPTRDILTTNEIREVFSDSLFSDLETVLITGGEPTLRADLAELIVTIHEVLPRINIFVSTNGLFPNRLLKVVKQVNDLGIKVTVGTSLDGIGEKHDLIRGVKGNFERVEYLLQKLKEDDININVGFVLSDLTIQSFKDVREYLEKLEINSVVQWYDQNQFYDNLGSETFSSEIFDAVCSLPETPHKEMWLNYLKGKPLNFSCFAMYTFFFLRCDGYVTPCLRFGHMKKVNVREMPPSELWKSEEAGRLRRIVKGCSGCLNNWGVWLSLQSAYIPLLIYKIKSKLRQ
jgi:MoaA/NifB/PqqE/SkfB family radical SAM enzyme